MKIILGYFQNDNYINEIFELPPMFNFISNKDTDDWSNEEFDLYEEFLKWKHRVTDVEDDRDIYVTFDKRI